MKDRESKRKLILNIANNEKKVKGKGKHESETRSSLTVSQKRTIQHGEFDPGSG